MAETVKVQHGCGCLSGCGTVLALFVVLGPVTQLSRWADHNGGAVAALGGIGIVGVCVAAYLYAHRAPAPPRGALPPLQLQTAPPGPPTDKLCPECGEAVKSAARVCRFCRHQFGA